MIYFPTECIKYAEWQFSLIVNLTAALSRPACAEAEYQAA